MNGQEITKKVLIYTFIKKNLALGSVHLSINIA